MAISKDKKVQLILDLTEKLKKSKSVVFTDYRGLTVEDIDTLRNDLRDQNVDYKIIKNTLFKIAIKEAGYIVNTEEFVGHPVAAAFSYDDEVAPARVTYQFSKKNDNLEILGGILEGEEINAFSVKSLAMLPSREELYTKVVGSIAAPMSGLVNVMTGNLRGLVSVLSAYREQRAN